MKAWYGTGIVLTLQQEAGSDLDPNCARSRDPEQHCTSGSRVPGRPRTSGSRVPGGPRTCGSRVPEQLKPNGSRVPDQSGNTCSGAPGLTECQRDPGLKRRHGVSQLPADLQWIEGQRGIRGNWRRALDRAYGNVAESKGPQERGHLALSEVEGHQGDQKA